MHITVTAEESFSMEDLCRREVDSLLTTIQVLKTGVCVAEMEDEPAYATMWDVAGSILWDLIDGAVRDEDDPAWNDAAMRTRITAIAARLTGIPAEEIERLAAEAEAAENGEADA